MRFPFLLLIGAASAGLVACEEKVAAPTDRGVCYAMAPSPDGGWQFNVVARNQPSLEMCAKELEIMRRRFLGMGGSVQELTGAYQGQFLFLRREGIFTSQSYNGSQYVLLVRHEGQLVPPGAISQ